MQTDTIVRTLPDLDQTVADDLGDGILLDVARGERTKRVSGRTNGRGQSHASRAWTRNGDVD